MASAVIVQAFENELGVQDPVGFWDPAGFTADGNVENFQRRRQTELKHGRVSMLATMGYITPEITGKLPGYLSPSMGIKFADVPNGLAAISKVPSAGWAQILAYGAFCELSQDQSPGTAASQGDFGFKVLTSSDPAEKQKKLAAELANGRLAMMAIIGMFFQDGLTGSAWGDWALYTASPLRAFENELGVQDPVGFWDPVGFTSEGNVEDFQRRRQTELKHGRVFMLATVSYIKHHGVHHSGDHGHAAWLLVSMHGHHVCAHAHAWHHGAHHSDDHRHAPWLLVPIHGHQVYVRVHAWRPELRHSGDHRHAPWLLVSIHGHQVCVRGHAWHHGLLAIEAVTNESGLLQPVSARPPRGSSRRRSLRAQRLQGRAPVT